ncbi:homogentisate phytyltransferase/homogentisate geranylgeranyltransferase [Lewinella marina]|uniref:Homogentisate phytyltransferase n=1 Tax=Neolewinella marina TaxID=438751 RepID=A0A2G0CI33_9BACT|nr:homogentisate phytyltransferase [Neolewinella marina]NJB85304.1 homogentisate phytyltransferase/homogentisate geranylgeranyltransferase [Neolewinella marina]PHK99580.1 homogentisate phytyltransferase [Neolewinella marina]
MLTLLRFARAHTIVGTTASLLALYLMASRHLHTSDWGMFAVSLLSCLAANVYITGLNQLTDVEIDRINKPYLPLASGAYSLTTGYLIVGLSGLLALITCFVYPPFLPATVIASMLLGTAYSVPPVRLKRFHFWAAICIIVVRGLIVNLLLYLHFRWWLGENPVIPDTVWLLTAAVFTFGIVIAWFKDLPDTEGDAAHGIRTLSLVKNRDWVFRVGAWVFRLTLLGVAAVAYRIGYPGLVVGQLLLLAGFEWLSRRLDLREQASIARFYQGVWLLFFLEYGIFAVFG